MFYYVILAIIFMCFLARDVDGFCMTIPDGSVGVARTFGVYDTVLRNPGLTCYNAFFTSITLVDIKSQIDKLYSIECISADKQKVIFPLIEITNQLPKEHVVETLITYEKPGMPYDKATILGPLENIAKEKCSQMTGEEMQGSKYSLLNEMFKDLLEKYQKNRPELNGKDTGIKILKVFVEIPKLNKEVEANYQMIATQKTAEEAERYRQLTLLKEKETRNKVEILEAEKVRDVAILKNQELIFKEEAESKIAKMRAESAADQKRINADAESYAKHKMAHDNQLLLTKEYLQIKQLEYYGCQNTIHYGDGPKVLITPPLQGAIPFAAAVSAGAA